MDHDREPGQRRAFEPAVDFGFRWQTGPPIRPARTVEDGRLSPGHFKQLERAPAKPGIAPPARLDVVPHPRPGRERDGGIDPGPQAILPVQPLKDEELLPASRMLNRGHAPGGQTGHDRFGRLSGFLPVLFGQHGIHELHRAAPNQPGRGSGRIPDDSSGRISRGCRARSRPPRAPPYWPGPPRRAPAAARPDSAASGGRSSFASGSSPPHLRSSQPSPKIHAAGRKGPGMGRNASPNSLGSAIKRRFRGASPPVRLKSRRWKWASIKPGRTVRPPASTIRVSGPARARISSLEPTAAIRPPRTAGLRPRVDSRSRPDPGVENRQGGRRSTPSPRPRLTPGPGEDPVRPA